MEVAPSQTRNLLKMLDIIEDLHVNNLLKIHLFSLGFHNKIKINVFRLIVVLVETMDRYDLQHNSVHIYF